MFKGKDEHHFILGELFWKVCLGQRKFNSIFILLALESVVTRPGIIGREYILQKQL